LREEHAVSQNEPNPNRQPLLDPTQQNKKESKQALGILRRDAVDTVVCAPDDRWWYHPKYVEEFPDINKLCNIASCWIYIVILSGAHYILHISRISVNAVVSS
jgi:hypothetical protein